MEEKMDISYYIKSGLLKRYALNQLNARQTEKINRYLGISLELGEALENIYIELERGQDKEVGK